MNAYARKLGLPEGFEFVDVNSTEDWALAMVPRPVLAVLMLFPVKPVSEAHRVEEAARIARDGQRAPDPLLYMVAQTIDNACGTLAVLHAVANACTATGGPIPVAPESWFSTFLAATAASTPLQRAAALEADDAVDDAHGDAVEGGQSAQTDDTSNHFVCFSIRGGGVGGGAGELWELDGRKASPIHHGAVSADAVLETAIEKVKEFMARDPEELRFTMVALVKSEEEGGA
jgi:ubiquitin carboxyl-terminal hydrolase L3